MNYQYVMKKLPKLEKRHERQFWLLIVLALVVLCQSLSLLVGHHAQQIVLVPLQFENPMWVSRDGVSRDYLETVGRYFALTFLNLTPETADAQLVHLLKWVTPDAYGRVRKEFIELRDEFNTEKYATSFFVQSVAVNPDTLSVVVTGILQTYVGTQSVTESQIHFKCQFSYDNGTLRIISMGVGDEMVS